MRIPLDTAEKGLLGSLVELIKENRVEDFAIVVETKKKGICSMVSENGNRLGRRISKAGKEV